MSSIQMYPENDCIIFQIMCDTCNLNSVVLTSSIRRVTTPQVLYPMGHNPTSSISDGHIPTSSISDGHNPYGSNECNVN